MKFIRTYVLTYLVTSLLVRCTKFVPCVQHLSSDRRQCRRLARFLVRVDISSSVGGRGPLAGNYTVLGLPDVSSPTYTLFVTTFFARGMFVM